jgi:type VI secretion system protein ImpG
MDPSLLRYYNRELQHIREMGGEFAREYPKIAGRLGMDGVECADPYVERLLEGFAFLAARVQLKIDAQHPAFTQHLLDMLYPQFLSPVPSMAVVQLQPDEEQSLPPEGHRVPRHTALHSLIGFGDRTACEYRTAHAVELWPLQLTEARYFETPAAMAAAGLDPPAGRPARAAIRLSLATTGGAETRMLALDRLPVFLRGADGLPRSLYEQMLGNATGYSVLARHGDERIDVAMDASHIQPMGFDDDEALLPVSGRAFSGYRLLQEYFACPERLLFVAFTGLKKALARIASQRFDIVVWLDRGIDRLRGAVVADNFRLFCTPAINLFPRRADRLHLRAGLSEYHVLSDRTRPMDFEVHSVGQVEGFGDAQEPEQRFEPFYGSTSRTWHAGQAAFYTLRREPRVLSSRQKKEGPRSSYVGTEAFLSLVDGNDAPYATSLRQLGMQLWCTNRDLPLHMPVGKSRTDFTLDTDAPVAAIRCVAGPTRPRASIAGDATAWRLISHLQLNYLSLLDADAGGGAAALREMLGMYHDPFDVIARRQVEGLREVAARQVVRRIPVPGPIVYGRGLEVTLTCEDAAFEGTGSFLFASVMQHFLARYVSLNAFTETVLRTLERGEVARWPAVLGKRTVS